MISLIKKPDNEGETDDGSDSEEVVGGQHENNTTKVHGEQKG